MLVCGYYVIVVLLCGSCVVEYLVLLNKGFLAPNMVPGVLIIAPETHHMLPKGPNLAPKTPRMVTQGLNMDQGPTDMVPETPNMTPGFPHVVPAGTRRPTIAPDTPHIVPQSPNMTPGNPHVVTEAPCMSLETFK